MRLVAGFALITHYFSGTVVWLDNLSAIRALLGISKPIRNLQLLREQEPKKEKSPSKVKKEKDDENKSGDDSDVIMIEDEAEIAAKKTAKVCILTVMECN